jgi:hypothetical protein
MSVNAGDESLMTAEQAIDISDAPPIIISRYGSRSVTWDVRTLVEVLARLQIEGERATATARLISGAEHIKRIATNYIIKADASS